MNFLLFATSRLKKRAEQAANNCEALRKALQQYVIDFVSPCYGEWRSHREFAHIKTMLQGQLAQDPARLILEEILLDDKMNFHNLCEDLKTYCEGFRNDDVEADILWPFCERNLDGYDKRKKIWNLTKNSIRTNIPNAETKITPEDIETWLEDSHYRISQSGIYHVPGSFYAELGHELISRRKAPGVGVLPDLSARLRKFEQHMRDVMFKNGRKYSTGELGRDTIDLSDPNAFGDADRPLQRIDYSHAFIKEESSAVKQEFVRHVSSGYGLAEAVKREQFHGFSTSSSSSQMPPYYRCDNPGQPVKQERTLNYPRSQPRAPTGWEGLSRQNEYQYRHDEQERRCRSASTVRARSRARMQSGQSELASRGPTPPVQSKSYGGYEDARSRSMSTLRVSQARFEGFESLPQYYPCPLGISRRDYYGPTSYPPPAQECGRGDDARSRSVRTQHKHRRFDKEEFSRSPGHREIGRSRRREVLAHQTADREVERNRRSIRERSPALPRGSHEQRGGTPAKDHQQRRITSASRGRSIGMARRTRSSPDTKRDVDYRSPSKKARRRSPARERKLHSRSRARSSSDSRERKRARVSRIRSKSRRSKSRDKRAREDHTPRNSSIAKKTAKKKSRGIPETPSNDKTRRKSSSVSSSRSRSRSRSKSPKEKKSKEKKSKEKKGEKKSSTKKRKVVEEKKVSKEKPRRVRSGEKSPEPCGSDSEYEWVQETVHMTKAEMLRKKRSAKEVERYYRELPKKQREPKTHSDSMDGVGGNKYRAFCINKDECKTKDGDLDVQWFIFYPSYYMLCTMCWCDYTLKYKNVTSHKKVESQWLMPISDEPRDLERQHKDLENRILNNVDLAWFVENVKPIEKE